MALNDALKEFCFKSRGGILLIPFLSRCPFPGLPGPVERFPGEFANVHDRERDFAYLCDGLYMHRYIICGAYLISNHESWSYLVPIGSTTITVGPHSSVVRYLLLQADPAVLALLWPPETGSPSFVFHIIIWNKEIVAVYKLSWPIQNHCPSSPR